MKVYIYIYIYIYDAYEMCWQHIHGTPNDVKGERNKYLRIYLAPGQPFLCIW